MSAPTRLPAVTDPSANGVADPVTAEVTLRDNYSRKYLMLVTCGTSDQIVPAAEEAVEHLELDLAVEDWSARS